MISLGIIGLGSIFSTQLQALLCMKDTYRLAAVCDCDLEKCKQFQLECLPKLSYIPQICRDSKELFCNTQIDAVLIAVPPASHFSLALVGLQYGKHILLEKPATLSIRELEILYREANYRNKVLHIAYHAAFAKDLEWFLPNREELKRKYQLGKLSVLDCCFYDPYMEHGIIIERKRLLGGSFIDSGVNALSVCARIMSINKFSLTEKQEQSDGITVYHAEHFYHSNDCTMCIRTGWDMGQNIKRTMLGFTGTDGKILLNHSEQAVIWIQNGRRKILFQDETMPRLLAHYLGVFKDFYSVYYGQESNQRQSIQIHKLLFQE